MPENETKPDDTRNQALLERIKELEKEVRKLKSHVMFLIGVNGRQTTPGKNVVELTENK